MSYTASAFVAFQSVWKFMQRVDYTQRQFLAESVDSLLQAFRHEHGTEFDIGYVRTEL